MRNGHTRCAARVVDSVGGVRAAVVWLSVRLCSQAIYIALRVVHPYVLTDCVYHLRATTLLLRRPLSDRLRVFCRLLWEGSLDPIWSVI